MGICDGHLRWAFAMGICDGCDPKLRFGEMHGVDFFRGSKPDHGEFGNNGPGLTRTTCP
jgi:hypothetical protein